jgi:hypothetical protein
MDTSIIPAFAGLTGAAIGGLTSGIASWFAQKIQSRVQLLAQDKVPRQELYKEFIETATQCYADALQHEKPDIPALVNLYGKIGRMRMLSSPKVIASAEQIGQKITNMYLEPNKTFLAPESICLDRDSARACVEEHHTLLEWDDTTRSQRIRERDHDRSGLMVRTGRPFVSVLTQRRPTLGVGRSGARRQRL